MYPLPAACQTDHIVLAIAERRIEGHDRRVRFSHQQVDLGAVEVTQAALRFRHHHPADPLALSFWRDGEVVDPTSMSVITVRLQRMSTMASQIAPPITSAQPVIVFWMYQISSVVRRVRGVRMP